MPTTLEKKYNNPFSVRTVNGNTVNLVTVLRTRIEKYFSLKLITFNDLTRCKW